MKKVPITSNFNKKNAQFSITLTTNQRIHKSSLKAIEIEKTI